MIVYLIMLVISLFFASCAGRIRDVQECRNSYRVFAVLSFLPFFIVSAIRYRVGTDWMIYDEYFFAINSGENSFKEPLFNLLNKLIYTLSKDSQWLFVISALLGLVFVFLAVYKQSKYIPFSILLFFLSTFYFNSLNQIRQGIAMCIFLYAYQYARQEKWKKYFIWIIIATGFHISSLVYLAVYFLYKWKADLKKHIIAFVVTLVCMPVLKVLLVKIISLTSYGWYFDSSYASNDFLLAGFLISFLILVLHEYYLLVGGEDDKSYSCMVNMQLLCVISLLCTGFIPQVSRIASAFEIISIISLPKMVLREQERNRRIVVYILITLLLLVKLLYNVYICGFYDVIPYQTIFSK